MNLDMKILNQDKAFEQARKLISRKNHTIYYIIERFNKNRHCIMKSKENNDKYYVIYKRKKFLTFDKHFLEETSPFYSKKFNNLVDENPSLRGIGESINIKYLHIAAIKDCKILIIYEDGYVMTVYAQQWLNFAKKYNLIRVQERENTYMLCDGHKTKKVVRERTYSIPIKLFSGEI